MEKYLYIAATVGLTVFGQLVVKGRSVVHSPAGESGKLSYILAMYTDPAVLAAMAAALLASVAWALAIEKTSLAFAYPFVALNFVLVPILGAVLFDEPLTAARMLGISLIIAGVVVNGLSS
jgi:multidrug transporter EmrE-like cation transporter